MKKQNCDFCGSELDFELENEVQIYNHAEESFVIEKDICQKCSKKVLAFLKTLKAI